MTHSTSDIAFTPAVKRVQDRKGSRKGYAKMEEKGGWRDTITEDLARFIDRRDSFYLGTASADGQPYIQHRGGKPGFLKVLDEKTLAFADFRGNRQYITSGNLSENDKAYIFLMDYPSRSRVKIWGRARVSVANSYSRGDREFEKATAMLFPSKVAQRGRMRDHTAAHFRRRVSV